MHPRVVAERRAQAQERMTEAAGVLTSRFGVEVEPVPPQRFAGQDVADLLAFEQTVALLDAIVEATAPGWLNPVKEPARAKG